MSSHAVLLLGARSSEPQICSHMQYMGRVFNRDYVRACSKSVLGSINMKPDRVFVYNMTIMPLPVCVSINPLFCELVLRLFNNTE